MTQAEVAKRIWYVYILRCADDTLYTGISTELDKRLNEHNHLPQGAKYTRARRPSKLIYSEDYETRSQACKREYAIKRMTRAKKEMIIETSKKNA